MFLLCTRPFFVFALAALFLPGAVLQAQTELSTRDRKSIESFEKYTKQATEQIEAKNLRGAMSAVKKSLAQLKKLTKKPNPEVTQQIASTYAKFKTAYEQVVAAGGRLPDLIELPGTATDGASTVSFTKDIAPILNSKCGNCHVSRQQGNYSLASFNAINVGGSVIGGQPDNSRLVEVIESGEMPQGGGSVAKEELDKLKQWIAEGARFDGENAGQSLRDFASPAMQANPQAMVKAPTGSETVSFSNDVAPILVENCQRCHMVTNPRGRFSMANFRALLRGGNGGVPIEPGKANDSQLIKRLRGDVVAVMPPGNKLSEDKIQKIVTWINEDATFDAASANTPLPSIAATAKANSMSHEEFVKYRENQTRDTWKLAMGDLKSTTVNSKNFFVTGDADEQTINRVAKAAEKVAETVLKEYSSDDARPFVRGNASIFVFRKRYDFGEFGRMIEKRDFPKTISSSWQRSPEEAYLTVLMTRNKDVPDIQVDLTRQIAALHIASQTADVPRWFADGFGWMVAKSNFAKDDQVKNLDSRASEAVGQMQRLDDFANNRIDADKAALVGYLFTKQLRKSGAAYKGLLEDLGDGNSFEASFAKRFGMPVGQMLKRISDASKR